MTDEQKRFFTAKALLVNPDWTHDDYRIQHFLDGCDSLIEYLDQREKINVDFESGYELRRTENEDHIRSLEAQLSSKEQDYNNCINLLGKERDENKSLRAENEKLKTELSEKGRECEALRLVMKDDKRVTENEVNDLQAEIDRVCKLHAQERKRCEDLEAALKELLYKFTSPEVLEPAHELTDKCRKLLSQ